MLTKPRAGQGHGSPPMFWTLLPNSFIIYRVDQGENGLRPARGSGLRFLLQALGDFWGLPGLLCDTGPRAAETTDPMGQ